MEIEKIVSILKQVDINLLLKQNIQKAVLADLLYDYEVERKILNTVHNSMNVAEKLFNSKNKLLEVEAIKDQLSRFGFNETTIEWALTIWTKVLDISLVQKLENTKEQNIRLGVGGSFTTALVDQEIYAWGNNKWGQLGNRTQLDLKNPQNVTRFLNLRNGETIDSIYSSFRSSYLVTSNSRLFSWGNNGFGQLGNGSTTDESNPVDITSYFKLLYGETIEHFATGGFHNVVGTSFNRVYVFGNNAYGQLGDSTNNNRSIPHEITSAFTFRANEKIEQISIGLGHSILSTSLGRVFTWGNNEYGQLGDGSITKRNRPQDISRSILLSSDDKIKSISLGALHSMILTEKGRVLAFGHNEFGQLGDGSTESRTRPVDITHQFNLLKNELIVQVTAGRNFTLGLTSLGRVFTWGSNKNGQLTIDDFIPQATGPIDVTRKIIKENDEWITNLYTGSNSTHCFALSSKGKLYSWGNNELSQLGVGVESDKCVPTEILIA